MITASKGLTIHWEKDRHTCSLQNKTNKQKQAGIMKKSKTQERKWEKGRLKFYKAATREAR